MHFMKPNRVTGDCIKPFAVGGKTGLGSPRRSQYFNPQLAVFGADPGDPGSQSALFVTQPEFTDTLKCLEFIVNP